MDRALVPRRTLTRDKSDPTLPRNPRVMERRSHEVWFWFLGGAAGGSVGPSAVAGLVWVLVIAERPWLVRLSCSESSGSQHSYISVVDKTRRALGRHSRGS